MRRIEYSVVFLLIWLAGCTEKIPQGPEKVSVLQVELSIVNPKERYPQPGNFLERYRFPRHVSGSEAKLRMWEEMTDYHVRFRLKVTNTFDETVDGTKWYDIQIHLWEPANPSWKRTLRYREFRPDEPLVLHPGQSISPYTADSLVWDQTDDAGNSIHETAQYESFYVRTVIYYNRRDGRDWVRCDTVYTGVEDTVKVFEGEKIIKAKAEVKLFREFPVWESNEVEFKIYYLFPEAKKWLLRKYTCWEGPLLGGGG